MHRFTVSSALVVLQVVAVSQTASAVIIRPDRDDVRYCELAQGFPAVCWIEAGSGSGVLIAPCWVLTAAHVVDRLARSGANFTVRFAHQEYDVARTILHPDYPKDPTKKWGPDLALMELARPVRGVRPVPVYVHDDELDRTAILVGFGHTGDFKTGEVTGSKSMNFVPTRRAGTNVICQVTQHHLYTLIDPLDSATDLEAALGAGDSGGPALVELEQRYYVAGVASFCPGGGADNIHQSYGDRDGFMRVSQFAQWIEAVTETDYGTLSLWRSWLLIVPVAVPFIIWLACRSRRMRTRRRRAA